MSFSNLMKRSLRTIRNVNWELIGVVSLAGLTVILVIGFISNIVQSCNAAELHKQQVDTCVDTTILTYPDGDMVALTCNVDIKAVRSHIDITLNKPLSQENANHLLLMKKGIDGRGY